MSYRNDDEWSVGDYCLGLYRCTLWGMGVAILVIVSIVLARSNAGTLSVDSLSKRDQLMGLDGLEMDFSGQQVAGEEGIYLLNGNQYFVNEHLRKSLDYCDASCEESTEEDDATATDAERLSDLSLCQKDCLCCALVHQCQNDIHANEHGCPEIMRDCAAGEELYSMCDQVFPVSKVA